MRFFDLHTDTASVIFDEKKSLLQNDLHVDLTRAGKNFEYTAFLTLFSDSRYTNMVGRFEALMENLLGECQGRVAFVKNVAEYEDAKKKGLMPMLLAVEGAEMLRSDPEMLLMAHREHNLIMSGITWNNPNPLYDENGLTPKGFEYVKTCKENDIVVDVSHLHDKGTFDVLRTGAKTVASHSNARSLTNVSRNLPDELIREMGKQGGLIGLNFFTYFLNPKPEEACIDDIVRHAKYIADLAGVETLAIGSDFDGAGMPHGITGVESLPILREALLNGGFTAAETEKICYENAFRFFLEGKKG
ncbi:MAG: membrane dipeptidase [Clostridia bacterium]|nr:membrane dipeptidase [Clostridia bacterium]